MRQRGRARPLRADPRRRLFEVPPRCEQACRTLSLAAGALEAQSGGNDEVKGFSKVSADPDRRDARHRPFHHVGFAVPRDRFRLRRHWNYRRLRLRVLLRHALDRALAGSVEGEKLRRRPAACFWTKTSFDFEQPRRRRGAYRPPTAQHLTYSRHAQDVSAAQSKAARRAVDLIVPWSLLGAWPAST